MHAKLEEELIYPEIRQEIDDDLIDGALEEYHVVHGLIGLGIGTQPTPRLRPHDT